MDRVTATAWLARLHNAQNRFYAGRDDGELIRLLSPEVEWHVPGDNAIAGRYRGVAEVMAYFERRRLIAADSFRLEPRDVLVGQGEWVANLVDGVAIVEGREERWSTVGLYHLRGGLVLGCHLLPLDPVAFDRIWSATRHRVDDA